MARWWTIHEAFHQPLSLWSRERSLTANGAKRYAMKTKAHRNHQMRSQNEPQKPWYSTAASVDRTNVPFLERERGVGIRRRASL